MKQASIRTCRQWLMGGLFITFVGAPTLVTAEARSFVYDQYYLGQGGNPPSLEQVAANPLRYFRSAYAYEALRARFAAALRVDEVSDEEFRNLIVSDRVELRPCTGQISTAGIVGVSRQSRAVRECYVGEQLIWLDVDTSPRTDWELVASKGCWNPTWSYTPEPPPPPKPPLVTYSHQPGITVEIQDFNSCGCFIPGVTVRVPGSTQKHVSGFDQKN